LMFSMSNNNSTFLKTNPFISSINLVSNYRGSSVVPSLNLNIKSYLSFSISFRWNRDLFRIFLGILESIRSFLLPKVSSNAHYDCCLHV
jgi:hypothetical protein